MAHMNTSTLDQHHPCQVCSKPTTMWCPRCESAWYCGNDHILSDWPRHKTECLPVSALSPAPVDLPPSMPFTTSTVSAIMFPIDEVRPRIVQIECLESIEPTNNRMNWTPRLEKEMGVPQDSIESLTIETGINEGEPLRFPLRMFFSRNGPTSHLTNQAVNALSGGQVTQINGLIIVLKHSGRRKQGYTDASPIDLPVIASYFIQSSSKDR